MGQRPSKKFRPDLERCEPKKLLNASPVNVHAAGHKDVPGAVADHAGDPSALHSAKHPVVTKYELFRITNTSAPFTTKLVPPFQQVLVQGKKPVPGQVYNVLQVAVKNGTSTTFDASDDLQVRLATSGTIPRAFPVLTGTQQWKPNQFMVFYVLTKKYYPVNPVTGGGFQFNLAGSSGTAIPGPSGIFLRLKYNPATFARTLDWIVAYGQGAQGGQGPKFGLPDTAIWEFGKAGIPIQSL